MSRGALGKPDRGIKGALTYGYIDQKEYQDLVRLADRLEIDQEDFKRSIELLKQGNHHANCPHCGK